MKETINNIIEWLKDNFVVIIIFSIIIGLIGGCSYWIYDSSKKSDAISEWKQQRKIALIDEIKLFSSKNPGIYISEIEQISQIQDAIEKKQTIYVRSEMILQSMYIVSDGFCLDNKMKKNLISYIPIYKKNEFEDYKEINMLWCLNTINLSIEEILDHDYIYFTACRYWLKGDKKTPDYLIDMDSNIIIEGNLNYIRKVNIEEDTLNTYKVDFLLPPHKIIKEDYEE